MMSSSVKYNIALSLALAFCAQQYLGTVDAVTGQSSGASNAYAYQSQDFRGAGRERAAAYDQEEGRTREEI